MPDWKDLVRFLDRVPMLFKERSTPSALFSPEGCLHVANLAFLDLLGVRDVGHLQERAVAQEIGISALLQSMSFVTASNGLSQSEIIDGELYPLGLTQRGFINVLVSFKPATLDGFLVGVFLELSAITEMVELTREVQKLSGSEQNLRTLFDSIPEPVTLVDLNGLYARVNPATEGLFGYAMDDLVGEHMSKVFPNYRNPLDKILQQISQSLNVRYQATAVRKNGVHIRVSALVVPQIVNFSVVGMYEFPRLVSMRAKGDSGDSDDDYPSPRRHEA
jgi:PAS domain S-box-containing protein